MQKVFLAYSHKDRDLASQIAKALTARGVSVWFDELQIRPGDDIASAIHDGLQSSTAVVLLLGSQTYGDSWSRREAALALSLGKHIFPILPRKEAEVPFILRHLSYLDLSDEASRDERVQKLAMALALPQPQTSISARDELARSEALSASATELKAEMREYERSKATQHWIFAAGTISAVVSTVVSIVGLFLGTESDATSKYFYLAVGGAIPVVAVGLALLTARAYVRKSEKNMEADHE